MLKGKRFPIPMILCITMLASVFFSFVLFPGAAVASSPDWGSVFNNSASWFGSADGIKLADEIVTYQLSDGGWRKDMTVSTSGSWGKSTIDNDTTTSQIIVLAKVYKQTNNSKYLTSCQKGIDLLLNGQYSNGGWPQVFNDAGTYHTHITYNDNAMIHVMNLLTDVSKKSGDFTFIDSTRASKASTAVANGIQCILNTQITSNGVKTAWCQQHDEVTLKPTSARAYELPSITASESTGIVNYLKTISNPSVEVINSINSAVTWMKKVQILGIKVVDTGDDRVVVNDSSAPPIWARFYEINTDRLMFVDRDGSIHYQMSELSQERRTGYAWYGNWPSKLVAAGPVSPKPTATLSQKPTAISTSKPTAIATPTSTQNIKPTPVPTNQVNADLNGDRAINMSDVMILASVFNAVRGDGRYVEAYDLNKDGAINMSDVMIIAAKFNTVLSSSATVNPTPTAKPPITLPITIYIAGDSTACNYSSDFAPRTGWGQVLNDFFNNTVVVKNEALSGRSSKSFVDEGALDKIAKTIKKGDYFFIQFAHNDEKKDDPARYTEPNTTFKAYLKQYVEVAQKAGATPVLISPIHRYGFTSDGKVKDSHGEYITAMQGLAVELKVPYIDVSAKSKRLFESLGSEKTKELFMIFGAGVYPNYPTGSNDGTHLTQKGAIEIIKLVIEGIRENKFPLASELK